MHFSGKLSFLNKKHFKLQKCQQKILCIFHYFWGTANFKFQLRAWQDIPATLPCIMSCRFGPYSNALNSQEAELIIKLPFVVFVRRAPAFYMYTIPQNERFIFTERCTRSLCPLLGYVTARNNRLVVLFSERTCCKKHTTLLLRLSKFLITLYFGYLLQISVE